MEHFMASFYIFQSQQRIVILAMYNNFCGDHLIDHFIHFGNLEGFTKKIEDIFTNNLTVCGLLERKEITTFFGKRRRRYLICSIK